MDKPPCVEPRVPLNWCARMLKAQQVDGTIDLPAEWWNGWKIQRGKLIGPGGMRFTPQFLSAMWRAERLANYVRRREERSRIDKPSGTRSSGSASTSF
jgi:fructose 1,6-bisphosphatase